MAASKLTSKGQATIPAEMRAVLGVKPGDSLAFSLNDAGEVVVKKAPSLADLSGMIEVAGDRRGLSVDDALEQTRHEIGLHGRHGRS